MKRQIHVGVSPLTNTIYAGYVLKDGQTWSDTNKTDVTIEALVAVAQHVIERGGGVVINANGKPAFDIEVKALTGAEQ